MKKIMLFAYTRTNLGDDLFVLKLLKKYPDTQFYIQIPDEKYSLFLNNCKNIIILKEERNLEAINIQNYDAFIYIVGSVFRENIGGMKKIKEFNDFADRCNNHNVPFIYISCNFDNKFSNEYFKECENLFKKCTDICFRDSHSYNLFKHIKSVRYAPDVILSYDIVKNKTKKNTVGISVIDLNIRPEFLSLRDRYINFIVHNINHYVNNGYDVYLFSFCEYEGDEAAINTIYDTVNSNIKNNVNKIFYNGNVDEFLNIFTSMENMICQRFHSMILSIISEQKHVVVPYSKKINHVIDDLNLNNNICDLDNISDNLLINLSSFKLIDNTEVKKLNYHANEQIKIVDELINQ